MPRYFFASATTAAPSPVPVDVPAPAVEVASRAAEKSAAPVALLRAGPSRASWDWIWPIREVTSLMLMRGPRGVVRWRSAAGEAKNVVGCSCGDLGPLAAAPQLLGDRV